MTLCVGGTWDGELVDYEGPSIRMYKRGQTLMFAQSTEEAVMPPLTAHYDDIEMYVSVRIDYGTRIYMEGSRYNEMNRIVLEAQKTFDQAYQMASDADRLKSRMCAEIAFETMRAARKLENQANALCRPDRRAS